MMGRFDVGQIYRTRQNDANWGSSDIETGEFTLLMADHVVLCLNFWKCGLDEIKVVALYNGRRIEIPNAQTVLANI